MRQAASSCVRFGSQVQLMSASTKSISVGRSALSRNRFTSIKCNNVQIRCFEENAWAAQRLLKLGEKLDKTPGSALEFFSSVEEFKDTNKYPEKVQNLAMEIMKMNIVEAHQMLELIQQRMGISDEELLGNLSSQFGVIGHTAQAIFESGATAGISTGGSPSAGATGAAPVKEEKAAEKTSFSLKLTDVPATAKIKIIKEVRTITGLGLKEAKDLVEKSPTMIKEGLKKEEAEGFMKLLAEAGAKVELL